MRQIVTQKTFGKCLGNTDAEIWNNMQEIVRDEHGKEIERRPWEVPVFDYEGQGFALKHYRPLAVQRRNTFVHWSCAPALHQDDYAVADIIISTQLDKDMFPWQVNTAIGSRSWLWPTLPLLKQKQVNVNMFDPFKVMSTKGAHMPLMLFMGMPSDTRRTPKATQRRAQKAADRGWTQERIRQITLAKGKGKGKDDNERATRGGGGSRRELAAHGDDRRYDIAWDSNADSSWTRGGGGWTRGRESWNSWREAWWTRGETDWRSN